MGSVNSIGILRCWGTRFSDASSGDSSGDGCGMFDSLEPSSSDFVNSTSIALPSKSDVEDSRG